MMLASTLLRTWASFAFFSRILASDITTFSDTKCQKSVNNLDAVNGYPDGVCTPLELGSKTFQIAKLDPGCAVTLYGPDNGPLSCSSDLKIVADPATCYNSSWVYYSIDGCFHPSPSSIVLPTVTPTPPSPSPLSSVLSQPTTSFPVSSAAATVPPKINSNHTGVIVGGIVAGVSAFALIFGIALFYLRRRGKPLPPPPSYELSNEEALMELSHPEKVHQRELYGHEAAVEIGRNSTHAPPVELPGDSVLGEDKKGLRPIMRIHMV